MPDFEFVSYVREPYFKCDAVQVETDLELLVQKALDDGAERAAIIDANQIFVDERAGYKCRIPRCHQYGKNLMCPPHTPCPSEVMGLVKNYSKAILIRKELEPEQCCIPGFILLPPEEAARAAHPRRMHEHELNKLVNLLEGEAFHMGYYLALGLGAGTCFWCYEKQAEQSEAGSVPGRIPCEGLKSGECAFPNRARPSMEACGIDVYKTASAAGWPIYVIGQRSDPARVPCVGAYGLLMVF